MFAVFCTLGTLALFPAPLSFAAETPIMGYEAALKSYQQGDMENALMQAKIAGANGERDAQALAGVILLSDDAGGSDPAQAVQWFLKAAMQGQVDAMVAMGKLGIENRGGLSTADGLNWMSRAAKLGRTDAMRALSDMYMLGKGTPPDPKAERSWLQSAAQAGDVLAMRRLGDLNFETDPKTALTWYEKAATRGDQDSAYIAGVMYAENFAIRPDSVKSAKWLRQAAQAGHPAAQADYGLLVFQGHGATRAVAEAAKWFEKSAKNGDPEGRFLYAYTLAKGEGVPKSYEDAYYWLLRADEDTGKSGVDTYDRDRDELKKRLEGNVAPDVLERARARAVRDRGQTVK